MGLHPAAENEIAERKRFGAAPHESEQSLEARVELRTAELMGANKRLRTENRRGAAPAGA